MRNNGNEVSIDSRAPGLKRYCMCLIEFLSDQATDPHLYFKSKLAADVSDAETAADVLALLDYLGDCIDAIVVEPSVLDRLNGLLTDQGMPSFSLLNQPASRELGRILASCHIADEHEYRLVHDGMSEIAGLSEADRALGRRLVSNYESGE